MIGAIVLFNSSNRNPRSQRYPVGYVVQESGCWEWIGAKNRLGYGVWHSVPAHRLSYERERGPIGPGLHIDHLCRNPSCIRPDHLEPVTPRENSMRGKKPRLTEQQVAGIRRRYSAGESSLTELAKEYGVHPAHLSRVARGERGYWGGEKAGVAKPQRRFCGNGHPWVPENIASNGRHSTCRICRQKTRRR